MGTIFEEACGDGYPHKYLAGEEHCLFCGEKGKDKEMDIMAGPAEMQNAILTTIESERGGGWHTAVGLGGVTFVNLTPHEITVHDGETRHFIPPAGLVARAESVATPAGDVGGIPVVEASFGVAELPTPEDNVVYIVSSLVIFNLPHPRYDVVAPDTGVDSAIRNEDGQIVGIRRFQRPGW